MSSRMERVSRHGLWRAAAVTVVVIAVGIGSLVAAKWWVGRGGSGGQADVPDAVAGPGPAGPTKPVSFHGVEVLVPRSWPLNAVRCGTPVRDTVVVGLGAVAACMILPQPVVSVVELKPVRDAEVSKQAAVADRAVRVDGHGGRRGEDRLQDGRTRVVLLLPDLDAAVVAESKDPALARSVVASARVARIDAAGCPDRVRELRPPGSPQRDGAARLTVPGTPVAGAVCRYSDLRLARSAALTSSQLQRLEALLNAAPVGTSRPGDGYAISPALCGEEERRGFVARFRYASGPPLEVVVHIGGCGPLGASNGARGVRLSPELIATLTDLVGYDGGYPDPAQLR